MIDKRCTSVEEAVSVIHSGSVIAVGGFGDIGVPLALCAALAFTEPNIALFIGQERNLERRIALDPTTGVVVDRFTRP